MKLTLRDGVASLLLAAILIPYVGYLVRGEMPFIQDPRGMSATGLVLGAAAFFTAGRLTLSTVVGKIEVGLVALTLAFGVVAVLLAETAAAEALVAVLVGAIVVVWAVQMLHHAGLFTGTATPRALPRH
jgi:hypothetical protein